MTHICVSKLTITGSDNGLSPGRRQAIIWTNDGILLIWPLGTNFSEILIKIHSFSFKKMHLKMSGKWWPFCLGLNVLTSSLEHQPLCQTKYDLRMTFTCYWEYIICQRYWSLRPFFLFVFVNIYMESTQEMICMRLFQTQLECAASNGNRYPPYPQEMATAISQ